MAQLPLHLRLSRTVRPDTLTVCLHLLPCTRVISFESIADVTEAAWRSLFSLVHGPVLDLRNVTNKGALDKAGRTLFALAQYRQALQCYARALELGPNATLIHNKGTCLEELGIYDEALACYDLALQIEPGVVTTRSRRAHCLSYVRYA